MARILLLYLAIVFFTSCNNNEEKIAQLNSQINGIHDEITKTENTISEYRNVITQLENRKSQEYVNARDLIEHTDAFIKEYPMASSYVYVYDKEPLDILVDYFSKQSEEERDKVIAMHLILQVYYNIGHNADTVAHFRNHLREIDNSKRACMTSIDSLSTVISNYQDEIGKHEVELQFLSTTEDSLNNELRLANE